MSRPDARPRSDAPSARPSRQSAQQQRTEQNRSALVALALEMFAANGYAGTTLAAIAERAGLTTQGVLHYFRSKERLFQAVIEESQRWARDQDEAGRGEFGVAGLRSLARFVGSTRDVHLRLPHTLEGEALQDGAPEQLVTFVRTRLDRIRGRVADCLREGQRDGTVDRGADVPAVAVLVAAAITGLQTQSLLDETLDVDAAFDVLMSLVSNRERLT